MAPIGTGGLALAANVPSEPGEEVVLEPIGARRERSGDEAVALVRPELPAQLVRHAREAALRPHLRPVRQDGGPLRVDELADVDQRRDGVVRDGEALHPLAEAPLLLLGRLALAPP